MRCSDSCRPTANAAPCRRASNAQDSSCPNSPLSRYITSGLITIFYCRIGYFCYNILLLWRHRRYMSKFFSTVIIIISLCQSSFAGSLVMVQTPARYAPPSGDAYKAIAAVNSDGYAFAAINSDNTLVTWGDGPNGEL